VTATFAVLAVLLAVATVTDLKEGRIPNAVTVTGMLVGLALGLGQGQFAASLLGLGVALAVGLPLFALGAVGGGDAKLLGAVGALLGPTSLISAILYAGLAGGAMALLQAVRRGTIVPLLVRTLDLALWAVTLGRRGVRVSLDSPGAISVPYGAAIAVGALAAWFFPLLPGGTP
jgi:prepilin peptidase CpaA